VQASPPELPRLSRPAVEASALPIGSVNRALIAEVEPSCSETCCGLIAASTRTERGHEAGQPRKRGLALTCVEKGTQATAAIEIEAGETNSQRFRARAWSSFAR